MSSTAIPTINQLELAARVGECIMPWVFAERFARDADYRLEMLKLVREHKVGGFCMFGERADAVARAVETLQQEAATSHGMPLIFSCDCEFGLPMRLAEGGTEFPDMMALGRTGDPQLAAEVGRAIALEMRALGLTWNFAPVADVNNNPQNPIINTRSFGDDPETVARFAVPLALAMQQAGVAACAKHFPGHGDTTVDSHRALPVMSGGSARFEAIELPPFRALIDAGIASVMTGHLSAPELARDLGAPTGPEADLPATLSPAISTTLLRERLGFNGIIVTDAMQMHAVSDRYGDGEGAVLAMLAGADVILMPFDACVTHEALLEAVATGRVTQDALELHVNRIHRLKSDLGRAQVPPDTESLSRLELQHRPLALEVARRAIEITGALQSANLHDHHLLVICDERPSVENKATEFMHSVETAFASSRVRTTSTWAESDLPTDGRTVVVTFNRARGYLTERKAAWTVPEIVASIAKGLRTRAADLAGLILFGDPYLDAGFDRKPDLLLKTYSESKVSIEVVTNLILTNFKR